MSIIDWKCKTDDCWHWIGGAFIYCTCCLSEKCEEFTDEQKEEYLKLMKEDKDG